MRNYASEGAAGSNAALFSSVKLNQRFLNVPHAYFYAFHSPKNTNRSLDVRTISDIFTGRFAGIVVKAGEIVSADAGRYLRFSDSPEARRAKRR